MVDEFAALRAEYTAAGLSEDEAGADPIALFRDWFDQARVLPEPNAMVLATTGDDDQPSARMVLLKGLDERGFSFFTNLDSAKGEDLAANPRCALLFPWHPLQRQVRVTGRAELLERDEVAAYFATRPRGAQLGAWASPQSRVTTSAGLDERFAEADARMPDAVEVPPHWGGYVVVPDAIEFWQGRGNRMHDRIRFRRATPGWERERLAP
ncbi:pyridoxamine 5'-phosphate oxidase [Nocardioides sp. AE5]|uniref:pyridoxamine 5'-phosphate oxidase n=1 Tax=Nocardioides sp. AE5 TaxID=2962573 RepID=UPI0028817D20|nr:pyridoxamine 5'-phosphate oxidase [Nocardioides sp. AE5]MDT0200779.1 pyridoxamine 5'-phosphate oxidase [Nocardioides sp. AE5]